MEGQYIDNLDNNGCIFLHCECCGSCWEDDYSRHDLICPNCSEVFLDGNINVLTRTEFEEIT